MSSTIFHRFSWVIPERLARASAPNYSGNDATQNMNQAAVNNLIRLRINTIVSVNEIFFPANQRTLLSNANIGYNRFPVRDFTAPTLAQLRSIRNIVQPTRGNNNRTLVYCGYGHDRTGTISAMQIVQFNRRLTRAEMDPNHVETDAQREVLRQWGNEVVSS